VKIPEFAVRRPVSTLMLTLAIVVVGVVGLTQLPIDLLPDISYPVVTVITSYEGLGPYDVERLISEPVESSLSTVSDVKHVTSVSEKGVSVVTVEFDWGTNVDEATNEVRDRLNSVEAYLPEGADDPIIYKMDIKAMPVMLLKVYSDAGRDSSELRTYAEDIVKPGLEQIDGVGMAMVMGGREPEFNVRVERAALEAYNVDWREVMTRLQAENVSLGVGKITYGMTEYTVRSLGEFTTAEDIGAVVVANRGGKVIRVRDVATVEDGFKERDGYTLTGRAESVIVMIRKQGNANTVEVADDVMAVLPDVEKRLPGDVRVGQAFDMSYMIKNSIRNVMWAGLEGALLAFLIVFVFLRNVRPTLVVIVAIPTSVLFALGFMYFGGFTINVMTLGGLTVALGRLVDDSIVVTENTFRHLAVGRTRHEAAEKGASEVGMAITASTLVTVIVFLPLIFVKGITGVIFKSFALTVTAAMLASLFVALTVVPMFASRFLSARAGVEKESGIFHRFREWYGRVLSWCLERKGRVVGAAMAAFAASLLLLLVVDTEFMPEGEESEFIVTVELPQGTPLEETERAVAPLYDYVLGLDGIDSEVILMGEISSDARGMSMGNVKPGPNTAILMVSLGEEGDYREFMSGFRWEARKIAGARTEVGSMSDLMMGGGKPVSIEITGYEVDELTRYAGEAERRMGKVRGIADVDNSMARGRPEIEIDYDRRKAAEMGFTAGSLASSVSVALEGEVVTRVRREGKEIDVRVRLREEDRRTVEDIGALPLVSPLGYTVPLREIATIREVTAPAEIKHSDQRRLAEVTANIEGRSLGAVIADARTALEGMDLPAGYVLKYAGEYEQMTESFTWLGAMLAMAVLLVYMIMAAEFESLVHPLAIMFAMPFAATGALLALFLTGESLDITALIGLIMLMGIAVTNAIVLVDYVNQLRRAGTPLHEALVEGAKVRLRPVVMTAVATVFAMLPMALALREGQELERSMAIVVIGGLATTTVLTLVIVPLVYAILDSLGGTIKNKFANLLHRGETEKGAAVSSDAS
jgi:HAE1 family hydrophobic/amphiphilic exporter-1